MSAAIYLRVSTEEQARHGVSLDAQAEACIAYCAMRHLPVAAVLRDEGVSSRIPLTERPVGRELCRMIDAGEVQHIVAYSISRLFRDSVEAITQSRRWDKGGISLHLLDVGGQVVDTGSAIGRFFFSFMAAMAEFERDQLSERVTDAMQQIANTGRKPANTVYGYGRQDGHLVIVENEARLIREAYQRVAEGEPVLGIVRSWLRRGETPRRGEWRQTSLMKMLKNPTYCGRFPWRGEVLPGTHEPIVSPEDWQRVQDILSRRSQPTSRYVRTLSPVFRCALCGSGMVIQSRTVRGRAYRYLRCQRRAVLPEIHAAPNVRYEVAVEALWDHVEGILTDGQLHAAVREYARTLRKGRSVEPVRSRIGEIDNALATNVRAVSDGLLSYEALTAANAPLMRERADLQARLEEEQPADVDALLGMLATVSKRAVLRNLRKASLDAQLEFFGILLECVEVRKGRLTVRYAGGLVPPVDIAL